MLALKSEILRLVQSCHILLPKGLKRSVTLIRYLLPPPDVISCWAQFHGLYGPKISVTQYRKHLWSRCDKIKIFLVVNVSRFQTIFRWFSCEKSNSASLSFPSPKRTVMTVHRLVVIRFFPLIQYSTSIWSWTMQIYKFDPYSGQSCSDSVLNVFGYFILFGGILQKTTVQINADLFSCLKQIYNRRTLPGLAQN